MRPLLKADARRGIFNDCPRYREEWLTDSVNGSRGGLPREVGGFSLVEVLTVFVLIFVVMAFGMVALSGYPQRVAARQAAQLFARDLTFARATAVRTQESVVIRFDESNRWYVVETLESTTEVMRRRFGTNADIDLSAIDLQFTGDSVTFNPRGIADLSGASGSLGVARFEMGAIAFEVSFNSMGASRVEEN